MAVATVIVAAAFVLLPLALGTYFAFVPAHSAEEFGLALAIIVVVLIGMHFVGRMWRSKQRTP